MPVYGIARYVLSRREALVAAGVSMGAPLTFHTSFVTAENLAYPLALIAVWAMLATLSRPSVPRDALVLGAIAVAAAAKLELLALVPAALTAVAVAALLARAHEGVGPALARALRRHRLLVAGGCAALAGALVYALIESPDLPSVRGFAEQAVWHVAALDLAVGVVPFVGALFAAYAFFRSRMAPAQVPFAAVALSVTAWVIVALAANHAGSTPPLHERSLIYVVPLFVVALLATLRLPDATPWPRVALLAAVPAALLPAALPFDRAIDLSTVVDTFALQPLARIEDGALRPIPHVVLSAVLGCLFFGLAYGVARRISTRALVALVLIAFVFAGMQTRSRIALGAEVGRVTLPWHRDWVDRAAPTDDIVLITDSQAESAIATAETLFFNESITSIYTTCAGALGPDFDERKVALVSDGSLAGAGGALRTRFAVVPDAWEVEGDVLATNVRGSQVLVRPARGLISVPRNTRAGVTCG